MNIVKYILILLFFSLSLFSESLDDLQLSKKDEVILLNKGFILKKRDVKKSTWPEVYVLTFIKATPKQSIAVFFAYHEHKNFIPKLLISKPVKYISPTDIHIYFEMNIPWPLSNSHFITGNSLKKLKNGGYRVKWYFVRSDSAKDSYGGVYFLSYKNKTLLVYQNFTHPKSGLAGLFKGKMLKSVKKTVRAIVSHIEDVTSNKKDLLKKHIANLEKALNGEYVYKNLIRGQ